MLCDFVQYRIEMSAAIESPDETSIKEQIKHFYLTQKDEKKYLLKFTFDGVTFETKLKISNSLISNKCILLIRRSNSNLFQSSIEANSDEKMCFNPILSKREYLPTDITQTDILQVFSTKLKFIATDAPMLSIVDGARLINPATKRESFTYFSIWRMLRGQRTLYEKYGYTNSELNNIRKAALETTWAEIKDIVYGDKTLQELVDSNYPGVFIDSSSIAAGMLQIPYDKADDLYVRRHGVLTTLIMNALKSRGKISNTEEHRTLTLTRDSEIWKEWDSKLKLISIEPIMEGGRSTKKKTRRAPHRRRRITRNKLSYRM